MAKMSVRLLDIAVMLNYLMQEEEHLDTDRTLNKLRTLLNVETLVDKEAVESALFSCRLADEKGLFKHPDKCSFWGYVSKITPKNWKYDRTYSLFVDKDGQE